MIGALGSAVAPFSIGSLPGKLVDVDGANSVVTAGKVSSITNAGSISCAFTEIEANRPLVNGTTFGVSAPAYTEATRLIANNAASAWTALHNATAATITLRLRVTSLSATTNVLLSSMVGSSGDVGLHVKITPTGAMRVEVGNGFDIYTFQSGDGVIVAGNKYTIQITKTASGLYTVFVNGVSVVSGTRTSISAASPSATLHLGYLNLFFNARSIIPRMLVHSAVHTTQELADVRNALVTLYP